MNCALMGFAGGALGSVDIFGNNMTFLQLLSFGDDLPGFKEYCEANTPPEYQGFQPDLTAGCLMSGAMMIIAVFSMMQGAQGFGTLMGALDPISKGLVGAGSLKQIVERVSPIDGFSEEEQSRQGRWPHRGKGCHLRVPECSGAQCVHRATRSRYRPARRSRSAARLVRASRRSLD